MVKENGKYPQGKTHSLNSLLHPQNPDERPWKYLPLVLVLGFIARAAVALSGDFVLHPDEIMQYLEPAHRLVFGSGISYWEYFYGARSWLVPGAVAFVLKLFDLVGLGEPFWYVGGVKLFFCAVSLLIPAGMYFFARRHFSETAARVALVAGAFWYELVAFAHKPMTEFVAAALLIAAFGLCLRDPEEKSSGRSEILAVVLAVFAVAVRMQYAPLALFPLGVLFLRTGNKARLLLVAATVFLAVGVFDAVTWNSGLFHSYLTNLRFNLIFGEIGKTIAQETASHRQFLSWLLIAGGGLSALCGAVALFSPRRYAFLLASIAVVLVSHSLQLHKEYRFIFAVIPLWLMIGSDIVARFALRADRTRLASGLAAAVFAVVSSAGILNVLPHQKSVYHSFLYETGVTGFFVRDRKPVFAAYRYLARAPGVEAVWHADRLYLHLPGYYYLHRKIPFYDAATVKTINYRNPSSLVTHIVISQDLGIFIPGYAVDRKFGDLQILRRSGSEPEVPKWKDYNPTIVPKMRTTAMKRIDPDAPPPPANWGINFAPSKRPKP